MLNRRSFLKNTMGTGAIAVAASYGLLVPSIVLGAWNKEAFTSNDLDSALAASGAASAEVSDKIKIQIPPSPADASKVSVEVTSELPNTESIAIYVEKNKTPLSAVFNLGKNTEPYINTRVKMSQSTNVVAVVTAGGKKYKAHVAVIITASGCAS